MQGHVFSVTLSLWTSNVAVDTQKKPCITPQPYSKPLTDNNKKPSKAHLYVVLWKAKARDFENTTIHRHFKQQNVGGKVF